MLAPCAGVLAQGGSGTAPERLSPEAIAFVSDIDGAASATGPHGRRALSLLDALGQADTLVLAQRSRIEIVFSSGEPRVASVLGPCRFSLHPSGVRIESAHCVVHERELAAQWRTLQVLPAALGRASASLRGSADGRLHLRAPRGRQLAPSLAQLRWDQPWGPGAAKWEYAVRLVDPRGRLVLASTTKENSIPVPDTGPWMRGQAYLWTVIATSDEGLRLEAAAEFEVVEEPIEERFRALGALVERAQRERADAESATEQMLLALELDRAGLRDEAQRCWRDLARRRPAAAPLVLY